MNRCVAMLRGINVGGKQMKMEKLRASFTGLGFENVRTYIQSGNVLFETKAKNDAAILKKIAAGLLADFGVAIPVLLRTDKELADVVKRNPFLKDTGVDVARLHVTFLSHDAPASAAQCLEPLAASTERYHISGREIFLYCPNGYGNTKLSNNNVERKLRLAATTRNWKSVNTLLAMSLDPG